MEWNTYKKSRAISELCLSRLPFEVSLHRFVSILAHASALVFRMLLEQYEGCVTGVLCFRLGSYGCRISEN